MDFTFLRPWTAHLLSILRIVAALLYLEHGTSKLLAFPAGPMNPPLLSLGGISGVLEIVLGLLLVVGFFTRPAAFVASGHMAFAFFIGHVMAKGTFFPVLNGGDGAVLFCFIFLYIAAAGPGPLSVDAQTRRGSDTY